MAFSSQSRCLDKCSLFFSMLNADACNQSNLHKNSKSRVSQAVSISGSCSEDKHQPRTLYVLPPSSTTINTEPSDKEGKIISQYLVNLSSGFFLPLKRYSLFLPTVSPRPLYFSPSGLPVLPTTGLFTRHNQRVQRVLLVSELIAVRLRVHHSATSSEYHPPLKRLRVSGKLLLPVWLSKLWCLPAGYRVPGPRDGNLSNALPLILAAIRWSQYVTNL